VYSLARYWNGKVEVRICTGRSAIDETAATGEGFLSGFKLFYPFSDLQTASSGPLTWYYSYNANGSLVEVTPKGSLNGARRYTYNDAGYLAQVESHNGASYQLQAEMTYNGLGQRLAMTAYALGQSVTTQYTLDTAWSGYPLAAEADGQTTYYLYGRGPLAEKTTGWSYYLKDGQGTARQLADPSGLVTLARTFTPWGDALDQHGSGDLAWGYFGGYMDAATGLLYVGNGQYYDPATGRFLTRQPEQINPYVPGGDPLGASVGVLGLLGMLRRRKRKGKLGRLDMLFLLLVVLAGGASLAACDGTPIPVGPSPIPPTQPPIDTPTPEPSPSQPGGSPAGIMEATIQIIEEKRPPQSTPCATPTLDSNGSILISTTTSQNHNFGTLITHEGKTYLYTHNHFFLRAPDATHIVFLNAYGERLGEVTAEEFKAELAAAYTDDGNAVLRAHHPSPLAIIGPDNIDIMVAGGLLPVNHKPVAAFFGNPDDVGEGASIQVVRHTGAIAGTAYVTDAKVDSKGTFGGIPTLNYKLVTGDQLILGDSGGGIWFDGKVIGNNWAYYETTNSSLVNFGGVVPSGYVPSVP